MTNLRHFATIEVAASQVCRTESARPVPGSACGPCRALREANASRPTQSCFFVLSGTVNRTPASRGTQQYPANASPPSIRIGELGLDRRRPADYPQQVTGGRALYGDVVQMVGGVLSQTRTRTSRPYVRPQPGPTTLSPSRRSSLTSAGTQCVSTFLGN
jgi:hypothetical protein